MARRVLVGPDRRRIEHEPLQVRLLQRFEDGLPAPLLCPAVEALENGVGLAVPFGQVLPRRAGARDPKHGVDERTVVLSVAAGVARLARKQRFYALVIGVRDLVAMFFRVGHGWDESEVE